MPDTLKPQKVDIEQGLSSLQVALLRKAAEMAARRHLPLYLVGGCVRDLLLSRPVTDFDLVVEGDAIALVKALATQFGGRVTTHARFGTAQWFPDEPVQRELDFISTRSETYKRPAALPTVKPGSLRDDLLRRDFTINTLALRLDGEHWGELRDDLGGLEDLQKGTVRVLHPKSFQDDPTRLYRAVRYEQRYGFQIASETLSLIPQGRPLVDLLSAQRIRHELDLILEEENPILILNRLADLDLLEPAHPGLAWNQAIRERFQRGLHKLQEYQIAHPAFASVRFLNWHFWLMGASWSDLESLRRRLHFHAELFDSLLAAAALFGDLSSLPGLKASQCVMRLEGLPLTAVFALFLAVSEEDSQQILGNYLENWRHVRPKTNGHDLKKRNLQPGPRYKEILWRLRQAWLDEEVKNESEELKLLDDLLKLD